MFTIDFPRHARLASQIDSYSFQCAYDSFSQLHSTTTTSSTSSISSISVCDRSIPSGYFSRGFGVGLFSAPSVSSEDVTNMADIGTMLHAKVIWNVVSLSDKLHFILDECSVMSISIVSGNCYMAEVNAKLLNEDNQKVVQRESQFAFTAFTTDSWDSEKVIPVDFQCSVKMCLVDSVTNTTDCDAASQTDDCPADGQFTYLPFGEKEIELT